MRLPCRRLSWRDGERASQIERDDVCGHRVIGFDDRFAQRAGARPGATDAIRCGRRDVAGAIDCESGRLRRTRRPRAAHQRGDAKYFERHLIRPEKSIMFHELPFVALSPTDIAVSRPQSTLEARSCLLLLRAPTAGSRAQ